MGLIRNRIECDFCVVGGGMAGMSAAIAAAREGLKVVLMHERPVLGGNASSEIRMWICGAQGENNRETGLLEEIALENLYRNPSKNYPIWDTVLYDFVKREKNIELLLNCSCMEAETEKGNFADGRDTRILSVTGYQMTTQSFFEVHARFYADCSGDSILAPLCQAEFRLGREDENEQNQDGPFEMKDDITMGMSCLLQGRETTREVPFTAPEFSKKLVEKDFENRKLDIRKDSENYWYLELGGKQDTIADTEILRDELVSLAVGTWDHIKNSGKFDAETWDLDFLGFLPGKRESRRMMGEIMITLKDISSGRIFEDEIAYGGWPLDDHFPGGFYHRGKPNTNIPTPAPYSLPYRALYSENVENLFFAGRNISMTHIAMSSIRVMATCALLGEAVGKAAFLAVSHQHTPHGVYQHDLHQLQSLLMNEDCFLPHFHREISDHCLQAQLVGAKDSIRNGQDRDHELYHTELQSGICHCPSGSTVTYNFDETEVHSVHIVFNSDLNRLSLPVSRCERQHSMRCNQRLDSPLMTMPSTLCRSFVLTGQLAGVETEICAVENNRKRSYHFKLDQKFDHLCLTLKGAWNQDETVDLISFDFN